MVCRCPTVCISGCLSLLLFIASIALMIANIAMIHLHDAKIYYDSFYYFGELSIYLLILSMFFYSMKTSIKSDRARKMTDVLPEDEVYE